MPLYVCYITINNDMPLYVCYITINNDMPLYVCYITINNDMPLYVCYITINNDRALYVWYIGINIWCRFLLSNIVGIEGRVNRWIFSHGGCCQSWSCSYYTMDHNFIKFVKS